MDRGGEDELILFLFLQGERAQTWWQLNSESSALTHFTIDLDLSLMLPNDTVGYGESKPHALAVGFRGKKRLKDFLHLIFWDSQTGVTYVNFNPVLFSVKIGSNGERSSFWHCLNGIPENVNKCLLQAFEIA
jgi:hypothetical protein